MSCPDVCEPERDLDGEEVLDQCDPCNFGIQNGDVCGVENDEMEDPDAEFPEGCDPTNPGPEECPKDDPDKPFGEDPFDPDDFIGGCGQFDPSSEEEDNDDDSAIRPATPDTCPPEDDCLQDPSKCEEPETKPDVDDLDNCENVTGDPGWVKPDECEGVDDETIDGIDPDEIIQPPCIECEDKDVVVCWPEEDLPSTVTGICPPPTGCPPGTLPVCRPDDDDDDDDGLPDELDPDDNNDGFGDGIGQPIPTPPCVDCAEDEEAICLPPQLATLEELSKDVCFTGPCPSGAVVVCRKRPPHIQESPDGEPSPKKCKECPPEEAAVCWPENDILPGDPDDICPPSTTGCPTGTKPLCLPDDDDDDDDNLPDELDPDDNNDGIGDGIGNSFDPDKPAIIVPVKPQEDPVEPDPLEPDSLEPDPLEPDPVEPDPVEPDPVEPDPVEPDPVEPDPVEPDPVEPDPVEPDPPLPPDERLKDLVNEYRRDPEGYVADNPIPSGCKNPPGQQGITPDTLNELEVNNELSEAAQHLADYNHEFNQTSHEQQAYKGRPKFVNHPDCDPRAPTFELCNAHVQRAQDFGYTSTYVLENVASILPGETPEDALMRWICSSGHNANMLNSNVTDIGVGWTDSQVVIVIGQPNGAVLEQPDWDTWNYEPDPSELVSRLEEPPKETITEPSTPKGFEFLDVTATGTKVVIIGDKSWSMFDPYPYTKFIKLKLAILNTMSSMDPSTRLQIVLFNEGFESNPGGWLDKNQWGNLRTWLDAAKTSGKTNPGPALQYALGSGSDVAYFLTDGDFTTPNAAATIQKVYNVDNSPIHVIHIGDGLTGAANLMDLAERSGGSYTSNPTWGF